MSNSTPFSSSSGSSGVSTFFFTDRVTGKITPVVRKGDSYYTLSTGSPITKGANEVITIEKPYTVSLGQLTFTINSTTPIDLVTDLGMTIPTYASYASILVTKSPVIFSAMLGSPPDPVADTGSGKVPIGGKILLETRYEIEAARYAKLDAAFDDSVLTIDFFNTCCGWGYV
jgi:hypothetical protein